MKKGGKSTYVVGWTVLGDTLTRKGFLSLAFRVKHRHGRVGSRGGPSLGRECCEVNPPTRSDVRGQSDQGPAGDYRLPPDCRLGLSTPDLPSSVGLAVPSSVHLFRGGVGLYSSTCLCSHGPSYNLLSNTMLFLGYFCK